MDKCLVSIIIPIFDSENNLEGCLDSIGTQLYQKLEIICINNESSNVSSD